jgi:hypothetical protein
VTARFLAPDPVGFASGGPGYFNRYAYTMNDPVNLVDPDGEAALDCCEAPPNPYAFTLARAENGRGPGRNGGVTMGGVRADSWRHQEQFTAVAERTAQVTVNVGMAGQGAGLS